MKIKYTLLMLSLGLSQITNAATCAQTGNALELTGLDGNGKVYVSVSEHNNECGCNAFRFTKDPVNDETAYFLDVLLAAKKDYRKVRIDLADDQDCNSANKVFIH